MGRVKGTLKQCETCMGECHCCDSGERYEADPEQMIIWIPNKISELNKEIDDLRIRNKKYEEMVSYARNIKNKRR